MPKWVPRQEGKPLIPQRASQGSRRGEMRRAAHSRGVLARLRARCHHDKQEAAARAVMGLMRKKRGRKESQLQNSREPLNHPPLASLLPQQLSRNRNLKNVAVEHSAGLPHTFLLTPSKHLLLHPRIELAQPPHASATTAGTCRSCQLPKTPRGPMHACPMAGGRKYTRQTLGAGLATPQSTDGAFL